MGADFDQGIAIGKTLDEAFHELHEERAWEYGHGGYTGTFAETPGAIEVGKLPARVTSEQFENLIWELDHTFYSNGVREIPSKGQKFYAYSPLRKEWVEGTKPFVIDGTFEEVTETYTDWRGNEYTATTLVCVGEKRRYSPAWPASFKKDEALQQMALKFMDFSTQKWEPAAAVELNDQERKQVLRNTSWHGKHGIKVWWCRALCSS